MSGCAKCASQEQCQECETNFFPYGERCYPCNPECSQCLNSPFNCMQCVEGFYQLSHHGRCLPCP